MDQRETKLIHRLKQLDSQSVPFANAETRLLSEGFTKTEVVRALYSFSYDGKPNPPKKENLITKYFAANPVEARKIGNYLLANSSKSGYAKKVVYALAAQYGVSPHVRAVYELKFADEIDFPYFTSIFTIMVACILIVKFNLSPYWLYAGPAVVTLYWLIAKLLSNITNR